MRVLHLSTESSWRGGEQQLIYLHEELLKKNIESTIACRTDSPVHIYCKNHSLPHVDLPFKSAYDISSVSGIKTLIRRKNIDILHMHTAKGHTLGVIAGILGLRTNMVLARRGRLSG